MVWRKKTKRGAGKNARGRRRWRLGGREGGRRIPRKGGLRTGELADSSCRALGTSGEPLQSPDGNGRLSTIARKSSGRADQSARARCQSRSTGSQPLLPKSLGTAIMRIRSMEAPNARQRTAGCVVGVRWYMCPKYAVTDLLLAPPNFSISRRTRGRRSSRDRLPLLRDLCRLW